ncbi:MAG: glycerol-3-phosphate 1-O-acyltransferase PlsY [Candidatus Omnitrophica bacterium]|jgi:glycerol-3-phosphate acyltransferase PlsY|nr:glycerol-3-phosphate 1-O-acyltransferase PlsY [Candidatus Omnitrophota bacterium]
MLLITAIIISYLVGSIPTAYLAGRILKGIDIREFGSGNIGATNALRVLGKKTGFIVLLVDVLKGIVPVILLGNYVLSQNKALSQEFVYICIAASCVIGHIWTIFLKFKGGKGVATSLGVLIGISLKLHAVAISLGIMLVIWLAVFMIFRMVSLASVIAALAFPACIFILKQPLSLFIFAFILSFLVAWRHRANILRIIQGKEPRLKL